MAYTKLGRIRPVYRGAWSASNAYTALEIVKSADGRKAYIAVKDVPKGTALTDAAYWAAVLDVSDVLQAADEAISAANEAAALAPKPLALTVKGQPAQVRPEEGSPLRPKITLLPVQSGSGEPSPDNVRPISGRTAVTVTRCGKNLLPHPSAKSQTVNGVAYTINADGTISANGTPADSTKGAGITLHGTEALFTVKAGSWKFICEGSKNISKFYPVLYQKTDAGNVVIANSRPNTYATFSPAADLENCYVFLACLEGYAPSNETLKFMIVSADDTTDYEPYQGEAFTINLGQTVYGGTLDAAKGELTITRKMTALNGRNWSMSANEAGRFLSNITMKIHTVPVCDVLPGNVWHGDNVGLWEIANNNGQQLIVRTDFSTLDEWTAWLTANDPHVCYELAEPVTVQLDPVQISALEGLNTVFSDGDSTELTYNKSLTDVYTELLVRIAALEAADT